MRVYQENWWESLQEYTEGWNKSNWQNNVLGVCCEIVGDDTGQTDPPTQELARILKYCIIENYEKR